ncbi:MAG: hypothetical protein IKJ65_12170 [Clostridia bacterium]|nr:hypothetical protein [Clostridia bacterium]
MKSCFFIGHRDAPSHLLAKLIETVQTYILNFDVTAFYVGNYGKFDHMAAKAVIEAKNKHPSVTLYMLIPYHPSERKVRLPSGFDGFLYPPGMETTPRRVAIAKANRYTIDHADYLIAYAWQPGGNAVKMVEYAKNKDIPFVNLALDG